MLITAYVFIGQQSHMSDMPLLHVICNTVKGNWYRLSRRFIVAAGSNDNCLDWCLFIGLNLFSEKETVFSHDAKGAELAALCKKKQDLHSIQGYTWR